MGDKDRRHILGIRIYFESRQVHKYAFTQIHKNVYLLFWISSGTQKHIFLYLCKCVFGFAPFWMGYFFASTQIEYTNYPLRQTSNLFPFFVFSSRSSDDSSPPDLIFSRSVMTLWKKYFYSKCTKKNQDHSSNRGIEKYFTRCWVKRKGGCALGKFPGALSTCQRKVHGLSYNRSPW